MSDNEENSQGGSGNEEPEEVQEVVGTETPLEALRNLLKQAQNQDTLYKGLHESCR